METVTGVKNGDGTMPDEFFPGIAWRGAPAPGSAPSRTAPPDTAVPDIDTGTPSAQPTPLREQAIDGRSISTSQPGQNDTFDQGEDPAYTDSGAGGGHSVIEADGRYPWQQQPGGR